MEDQRRAWLIVLTLTLLATVPVSLVLFIMGLVIVETVIYPLATLGVAVTAGLMSGLISNAVTRPHTHTDISAAVSHTLAVTAWVAIATPVVAVLTSRNAYVWAAAWLLVGLTAAWATFQYRRPGRADRHDVRTALLWLAGSILGGIAVVLLAAAAGLTGA